MSPSAVYFRYSHDSFIIMVNVNGCPDTYRFDPYCKNSFGSAERSSEKPINIVSKPTPPSCNMLE